MNCRMCNSTRLFDFLDLGFTPPADQFRRRDQLLQPSAHYPLIVCLCEDCGLVQLRYVVSPEILYRQDYPYEASTTRTGQQHFHDFAASVVDKFDLGESDLAVDIGSNVGVLLEGFKDCGLRVLGVDPATNIVRIAEKRGIETIDEFFTEDVAASIVADRGQASVISGSNVFAHIDDLNGFGQAVDILLEDTGVLVIEVPHLLHLISNLEYDTIYHEHLSYISVEPLVDFFSRFGMQVINVERKDIHGGSIRIFISRQGVHPVEDSVAEIIAQEQAHGLRDRQTLLEFAERVWANRAELIWLLRKLKHEGKSIAAVSAPAKGMTLLNYCKIGRETLDYVTEKAPLKIGRFTPGDHIPVLPDARLYNTRPDYVLLLAWNFAQEIMANISDYTEAGGKVIVPIPTPVILDKDSTL